MYRLTGQIIVAVFCISIAQAQSNGVVVGGKWPSQIFVSDVNGRPFENRYGDVNGTPYFTADYKFANIILTEGRRFEHIKMRINLVAQEIIFVSANGVEAYMEAGTVKEIMYADTTTAGIISYTFRTGFPAIDNQSERNFYQVLADGRCSFVKSMSKKISERKNELSGEIAKDFETTEEYYLFVKGVMKRIKKEKDFILGELSDKQVQVNQFVLTNKINFRNPEQISKLLNYYNSL